MTDVTNNPGTQTEDAAGRAKWRPIRRALVDFALGVMLFSIAADCFSNGAGQAFAGASGWVTTVAPATLNPTGIWHTGSNAATMVVLALSFGAMTAFNLAIARHLHVAAASQPVDSPVE